jgi:hypothetical protein
LKIAENLYTKGAAGFHTLLSWPNFPKFGQIFEMLISGGGEGGAWYLLLSRIISLSGY